MRWVFLMVLLVGCSTKQPMMQVTVERKGDGVAAECQCDMKSSSGWWGFVGSLLDVLLGVASQGSGS